MEELQAAVLIAIAACPNVRFIAVSEASKGTIQVSVFTRVIAVCRR